MIRSLFLIRLFLIGSTRISVDSIDATVHDDLRLMFILFKIVDSFLTRSLFLIRSFLIGLFSWSGIVPSVFGLEIRNKCTKRLIRSLFLIRSFLIGTTHISVDPIDATVQGVAS